MSDYVFHGIKFLDFERLHQIIDTGYILSRKMMGENKPNDTYNLFNGTEYISLSMPSQGSPRLARIFKNAYNYYIFNNLCIVFGDVPNIIYPLLMCEEDIYLDEYQKILRSDEGDRFSYFMDEVMVKDKIDLSRAIAIGYPLDNIKGQFNEEKAYKELETLYDHLEKKNINIPVIDSTHYGFADTPEDVKKYTLKR